MPSRPAVERRLCANRGSDSPTCAAGPPRRRSRCETLSLMAAEGNALLVRRYRDDDHDAVWALHNLALDSVGARGANGPWDDDLHSIPSVYIDARGEFLVGRVDGDIVAIGALRQSGPGQGEIKRMRVHPRFQRCGFGRRSFSTRESRPRTRLRDASSRHNSRPDRGPGALQMPRLHGDAPHPAWSLRGHPVREVHSPAIQLTRRPSVPCRDALPLRRDARAEREIRRSRFRSTRSRPPGYPPVAPTRPDRPPRRGATGGLHAARTRLRERRRDHRRARRPGPRTHRHRLASTNRRTDLPPPFGHGLPG